MRKWLWRLATFAIVLLAVGGAIYVWAMRQTRYVPDFYTEATQQIAPEASRQARREMESDLRQLQADAAQAGSWTATFSDVQINAWLAEELPKKFPQLLAKGASDPRIVIRDGVVLAAARYQNRHIDTVVSCELRVELTEEPNLLALHVRKLRAGALPVPLGRFIQGISKEAAKGDIHVQWDRTAEDTIALVKVPSDHPGYAVRPVIVESVSIADGAVTLSGHCGPLALDSFQPRGPIHRFVSYQPRVDDRNWR
ncbi:MAG: hypothetical protein AAF958_13085 [Planctomycetota bacterium]